MLSKLRQTPGLLRTVRRQSAAVLRACVSCCLLLVFSGVALTTPQFGLSEAVESESPVEESTSLEAAVWGSHSLRERRQLNSIECVPLAHEAAPATPGARRTDSAPRPGHRLANNLCAPLLC